MENYVEHLVKGKKDTKVYIERGVALALPFLCFFIFLLLSLPPFLLELGQYPENRLEGWRREGVSIEDYAGLGENTHYFYLVQKAGKKYALILDCPEKLLKEMRLYSREKGL